MDYFTIGEVSSSSFNAYIYDSNVFDSPSRSVDTYDVPGRNGTLTVTGSEKFVNRELWYDMYIPKSMISNVRGLTNYLHSLKGYQRLEDTIETDVYKKAMYVEALQLSLKTSKEAVFRVKEWINQQSNCADCQAVNTYLWQRDSTDCKSDNRDIESSNGVYRY